ncbi:E7 [Human papillomavirus type 92]|uniref:Protein E7 n=1 Tax=Human papillomavirus type 92 TaxID=211787 RepID=Q8B5B5_HPV92|nr:E7 [Human papillomavirus type 92]AAO15008.1 E7 [Human papillomavirus type 92]
MIGKQATIPDIVLDLQDLVQPIDLHCDEDLSENQEEEPAPQRIDYKIVSSCGGCGIKLRIFASCTQFGIRTLQDLLLEEIALLCPDCKNGR